MSDLADQISRRDLNGSKLAAGSARHFFVTKLDFSLRLFP
jgi:hypothetical protein